MHGISLKIAFSVFLLSAFHPSVLLSYFVRFASRASGRSAVRAMEQSKRAELSYTRQVASRSGTSDAPNLLATPLT